MLQTKNLNNFKLASEVSKVIANNGIKDPYGVLLDEIISAVINEFPSLGIDKSYKRTSKILLLIKVTAITYGVDPAILLAYGGKNKVREARAMVYFIIRDHYKFTYQEIANLMRRKSHVTVYSGAKRISGLIATGDHTTASYYDKIKKAMSL